MARTMIHNGIKLAYEDRGAGQPAFVFIHGWTCDRSFFAPQAEYFARQHRVICMDLRGHGESDKPVGSYSITDYVDDIAYLLEQLGIDRVVAVGHSMGGSVALQLAASCPDRVAAIVMVDPAPLVYSPEARAAAMDMVKAIEAGDQALRSRFIVDHLFLPTSDRKLVDDVLAVMLAAPDHVAASAMKGILAFDGPAVAAQCKVPALHIAGVPRNPPHLMSQWLPAVVNGWTVGAGHFNQLEVPDQVNSMIEGFLRHYP